MFYKVKVTETTTQIVLVEADTQDSALAKSKDGYGQVLTTPTKTILTETISTHDDHLRDLSE